MLRGKGDAMNMALAQFVKHRGAHEVVADPAGALKEMLGKTEPRVIEKGRNGQGGAPGDLHQSSHAR